MAFGGAFNPVNKMRLPGEPLIVQSNYTTPNPLQNAFQNPLQFTYNPNSMPMQDGLQLACTHVPLYTGDGPNAMWEA